MNRGTNPWLVVAALLAGVLLGRAWAPDADHGRDAPYLERLRDALQLRPAQVKQIETLLAEEDRVVQELVESAREDLAGPVSARREQTERDLRALLDAEQLRRFDELAQR